MRAIRPGWKWDKVFVIFGPQGAGKGLFVKSLFPKAASVTQWASSNLKLHTAGDDPDRKNTEKIKRCVICELPEGAGMATKDPDGQLFVKGHFTETHDNVTPKFKNESIKIPRRSVYLATMNADAKAGLPEDPSGMRRYLSIRLREDVAPVPAAMLEHLTDDLVERLWAEAYHACVDPKIDIFKSLDNRKWSEIGETLARSMENVDPQMFKIANAAFEIWESEQDTDPALRVTTSTVAIKLGWIDSPDDDLPKSQSTKIGLALARNFEKKPRKKDNRLLNYYYIPKTTT